MTDDIDHVNYKRDVDGIGHVDDIDQYPRSVSIMGTSRFPCGLG